MGAFGRAPSRIVGRDELRHRIAAVLEDPRGSGTVVLSGEPGIGKTVLAHAAAHDVEDAHILMGACLPLSTLSVPYLPLRAIARAGSGEGVSGVDFDEAPAHVLAGLDRWLDEVADGGRVVLLIDDIQWADAATLDSLLYLIADPRKGLASIAEGHFARVEELAAQAKTLVPHEFAAGQAEAALDRDEPWTAVALLAQSLPRTSAEDFDELLATVSRVIADARRTGELRAEDDLAVLESFIADAAVTHAAGDCLTRARRALADAEQARAVDEDTAQLWERAADANAHARRAWEEAYACRRAAESLLVHGRGDRAGAAPLLRRSLAISSRLGARPLEDAVRALARFARITLPEPVLGEAESRRPSNGLRPEPAAAPAALDRLTRREAEIARLVMDGLTYREIAATLFISEKTVSSHMSNILRKTGAANRVDLARRASTAAGARIGPPV